MSDKGREVGVRRPQHEEDGVLYCDEHGTYQCRACGHAPLAPASKPQLKRLEAQGAVVKPRIVCLCGSTRFIETFAVKTWELERQGYIVLGCTLLPTWYCNVPSHFGEATGTKAQCDELHLRKIDLADEVLVLNVDGYIGESTRNEIAYADAHGKPVRYLEPMPADAPTPPTPAPEAVMVEHPFEECPADCPIEHFGTRFPDRCHRKQGIEITGVPEICGQPRSRHRQPPATPEADGGKPHATRVGTGPCAGDLMARPTPERYNACVDACAGVADPEPGELARLRQTTAVLPINEVAGGPDGLKLCPFCDSEAAIWNGCRGWCPACGVTTSHYDNEDRARAAWNRRPTSPSPADGAEGRRADISRWFYALKHEHVNGEVIPCATHRDTEKILRKFEIADKAATENGRAYGLAIARAEAAESALADALVVIEAINIEERACCEGGHAYLHTVDTWQPAAIAAFKHLSARRRA